MNDVRHMIGETMQVKEDDLSSDSGARPEVTPELIDSLIVNMPELADCDKDMLLKGMQHEMEHFDSVGGDINIVAKITCDHMQEFPDQDYYGALAQMEANMDQEMEGGEVGAEPVGEKWDTKGPVVSPSEEGKYKGKTIADLRKMRSTLKSKKERTKEESDKLRELNFAIRSKTGWGKVSEEAVEQGKSNETKEPKEDEQIEMKKEANKKEEDRINKEAAEKK